MGQLSSSAFQTYNPGQAGAIVAGPFSLYAVSVDSIDATQMNEGYTEVNYKTSGFDNLAPSALNAYLLGYIEPVVIGPGGQMYLLDGHHTFTALENSIYGASNPTVYVNVVANYSSLTTAQFWTQMEAMNTVLALNNGVPQTIDPNTGLPLPTALTGLSNDPYRGLEYSILKNKSSALFTTTANITGAVGASTPGLDKMTGFYSDFIWAAAYRNALGGYGLPYLSPGDIALATQWNLNGSNVTTIPGTGQVSVAQLPGYILNANIAIASTISDATLSTGTLDGNGGFTGITSFSFGSITLGTPRVGLVLQLGNDKGYTVTLTGTNTYNGGTTLLAGTLIIGSDAALGAAPPVTTTINPGAIVASVQAANGIVFNGLTEGNPTLTIGTASGNGTATFSTNRAIAIDGEVATINLDGYLATFTGPIVSVGSDGTGIGNTTGVSDITVNDTSTGAKGVFYLRPTTSSQNAGFYGNWIISAGTLNVTSDAALGNTSGPAYEIGSIVLNGGVFQAGASFSSVRSLSLGGGSTFDTNGFTTSFAGALSDTQRTLTVINSSTTSAGAVTFGSFVAAATASLKLTGGTKGETVTLTGGFVRSGNATVLIQPTSATTLGTTEKILATTAPTLTNGIVSPWIIADNGGSASTNPYDFVTYGANGFVKATYSKTGTGTSAGLAVASATDVVEETTGTTTLTGNAQAYALKVDSGATITLASGKTLTLGDGANPAGLILVNGVINGGTLAFGGSEAIIQLKGSSGAIASQITGSNGLTLAGSGGLTLSTVENISGAITIDSGTLTLTAANALAGDVAGVNLLNVKSSPSNAILTFTANQAFTTLNSVGNNSAINFSNGARLTLGDTVNNLGSTISSTITETGAAVAGALTINGSGLVDLTGISTGKLILVAGSTIAVNGGQLRLVAKTIANANTITTASGAEVQFSASGGDVWSGNVTGAGDMRLISGTLKETGTGNTYTGGTFVEVGATLDLTTANVSTGNANIGAAGGTVVFDQNTNGTYTGVVSDAQLMGTGATLSATLVKDDSTTDKAGVVKLTQAQAFTGATYIEAGGIELGAANALITSSGVTLGRVGGGATASLTIDANQQLSTLSSDAGNTTSVVLNGNVLTLAPSATASSSFGGVISDGSAAGGALVVAGSGTVDLNGANTFTGGITITSGTLELGNTAAAGTGIIGFAAAANATLKIDSGASVGNAITGFTAGDTIDLAGLGYSAAGTGYVSVVYGPTSDYFTLKVVEGGVEKDLNLYTAATNIYAGELVHLASDGNGGVLVTLESAPTLTVNTGAAYVNAAGETAVAFTVSGLATADTGTVIFHDSTGKSVAVTITGGQTSYTANLAGFADGAISSALTITGNSVTAAFGNTVTLDTAAPVVAIASPGGLTNQPAQTISGTVDAADAGTTVTIMDGTTVLGTATVGGDGTWSSAVTLTGQGTHTIVATDTDAAGNTGTSSTVGFTLDTIAPVVAISSTGGLTNQPAQAISGTVDVADAGTTVTIMDGTTVLGTATVGGDGTWSSAVTLTGQGTHTIVATDTDAAGNTGTSSTVSYTLDTIAPVVAITSTGGLTNQPAQTISGTVDAADAGTTVTIMDGTTVLGTATVGSDGTWSSAVTLTGQGTHTIVATDTDAAGNTGTSSTVGFTLDTVTPAAPAALADAAIIAGYVDYLHDTAAQALTGTAEAGATIAIYDGTSMLGTVIADATTGAWSYTLGVLADGTHALTATATDAAGNTGPASAALSFIVDTAPIAAPSGLADAAVAGGYVNIANDTATQALTGSAAAGATVTIYENGKLLGSAKADATTGLWSFKVGKLATGTYRFTATATNASGQTGVPSSALSVIVRDTAVRAPSGLGDSAAVNGYVDVAGDTAGQTLTGIAPNGSIITVYANGVKLGTTTTADMIPGAGTSGWTFNLGALATGTYKLTATATDVAGNVSISSGFLSLKVFAAAPAAPTALTDAGIIGGYVNALHDRPTQALTGMAAAGTVVSIYDEGVLLGTARTTAGGTWRYTLGTLTNGAHSLTAIATDAAGDSGSTSAALAFTVDTVVPAPAVTDITYNPAAHTATLTGVTDPGLAVSIFDNSVLVGSATADASGAWSFTANVAASVSNRFSETSTDAAGNVGKSAGNTYLSTKTSAVLTGSTGNDVLLGAPGETLTGGAGADLFVFHAGFGKETITDFTPATATVAGDSLQFDKTVFADWAHLLGATTQVGSDLDITLDANDVIVLKNVALASFTQASAHFI